VVLGSNGPEEQGLEAEPVLSPVAWASPDLGLFGRVPIAPAKAFPLYDGIYVLPMRSERADAATEEAEMQNLSLEDLDPFDLPERDRMYQIALTFVANHVRTVRPGNSVRSAKGNFGEGSLVISDKPIPRIPLRFVHLTWAVDRGRVVDARRHTTFGWRLEKVRVPSRQFIWAPGQGDIFDVAYFLANICAILGLHLTKSVAAVGDVDFNTNQLRGSHDDIDERREAALRAGIPNLILPFRAGFTPGNHLGVDYWPARDTGEAAFSFFATASSEVALPDLKHRWRVKMAFSWISLIAVLLGIGATELSNGFIFNPTLLRWTVGVAAALLAVSLYATHKYNRMDN
jgi:hypothetical protein